MEGHIMTSQRPMETPKANQQAPFRWVRKQENPNNNNNNKKDLYNQYLNGK